MSKILPLHEIEEDLPPPELQLFPATDPKVFSIKMADCLMNLCALAQSGHEAISIKEQAEDIYAAFNSRQDAADLLNVRGQTRVQSVPFGQGQGYGPFVNAYRAEVSREVSELPRGKRLWLTGHGIGAAYALLAAIDLQQVAAVYTFGAPRVGDHEFVRAFPCPAFRIVNNLDVMVTMPAPWHWRHAGEYKLINADGSLNPHPNTFNRLPSLGRQTLWLGELLSEGLASGFPRPLFKLLRQVLGDHTPQAYIDRLHALEISR